MIGPNVNQVARMEELTKHQEIKDIIGPNGSAALARTVVALGLTSLTFLFLFNSHSEFNAKRTI